MKNQYNISVTLTPVEHYFFGGENLNPDGTENYLQHSLKLPQQTTLLGAMRFLLLQTADKSVFNNNKIQDKEEAKKLIGYKGFDMQPGQYGKITSLSEVLLWHHPSNKFYLPLLAWEDNKNKPICSIKKEKETSGNYFWSQSLNQTIPVSLSEYNYKKGVQEYWISTNGQLKEEEIFSECIHAGNYKNKPDKKENDDDAYFKLCYYSLRKDFSFVFNMEVEDENIINKIIDPIHNNKIINVGGRSKFICSIEKITNQSPKYISEQTYNPYTDYIDSDFIKVVLSSDAYSMENPNLKTVYSITFIKKLRFMKSKVDKTNAYYNTGTDIVKKRYGLEVSRLYNLIRRGSVFFFQKEKEEELETFLKNNAFQTIGYNKYHIIK